MKMRCVIVCVYRMGESDMNFSSILGSAIILKREIALVFAVASLFLFGCSGINQSTKEPEALKKHLELITKYFEQGNFEKALIEINKSLEKNRRTLI